MKVLILQDSENKAFAQALERAIRLCGWAKASVCTVNHKSLEGLLQQLGNEEFDILFLDAHLAYQGCEDPLYGGLELFKHIRLSPSPNQLSLCPIVVGTVDSVRWLIRQSVDHAILYSPGCEVVEFPAELGSIRQALKNCRAFADYKQMRKAVLPFVLFTDQDQGRREHEYRNRAGVGKFLKEFARLKEDDPDYQYYEGRWQNRLWFKKMQFLNRPGTAQGAAAQFDQEMSQHNYILIDDEHKLGWSFGLYTGLFGRQLDPGFFESDSDPLGTPNGKLLCIASFEKAKKFFDDEAEKLNKLLSKWAEGANVVQEIMESLPYHVVFLDLRLEPADEERPIRQTKGIEILKLIKEKFPELPVIMLTASKQAISEMEARRHGADAYWIKDVSSGEELRKAIKRCLEKARLREIWRAIRMVEEKESLWCYEFQEDSDSTVRFNYRELPREGAGNQDALDDRRWIHRLLRESFQLLWEGEEVRGPMHSEDHPYDLVIINMGLIQQLRLKGLGEYSGENLRCLPYRRVERKLRNRRNDMVHPNRTNPNRADFAKPASSDEAVKFVKFTLNRLLGWDWFQINLGD
jgi:CheY-like chemotaxis protein